LSQDQGIRAVLHVTNDLCYLRSDQLDLSSWGGSENLGGKEEDRVTAAIRSLKKQAPLAQFIQTLAARVASYDWRASSAPGLPEKESMLKAAFRGSGGYKELRRHLLRHMAKGQGDVAKAASEILKALGY
jgi:hypothetical protein